MFQQSVWVYQDSKWIRSGSLACRFAEYTESLHFSGLMGLYRDCGRVRYMQNVMYVPFLYLHLLHIVMYKMCRLWRKRAYPAGSGTSRVCNVKLESNLERGETEAERSAQR
jgi:hypothetical protein